MSVAQKLFLIVVILLASLVLWSGIVLLLGDYSSRGDGFCDIRECYRAADSYWTEDPDPSSRVTLELCEEHYPSLSAK